MAAFDGLCKIPLDLVFLQDTTGSFENDLPNVQKQLPRILDIVSLVLPGSRFSVADFRDKPYALLGEDTDWCHKQHVGFTSDADKVKTAFRNVVADGGADVPEAMSHALLEIAYDHEQYDWCTISQDPGHWNETDECSGRVIIISTDAGPHDHDDYTLYNGADPAFPTPTVTPLPPYYMPPFPDSGLENLTADDWDQLCLTNEYPTQEQLVAGLKANNITLMVLVPDDDEQVVKKWEQILQDLDEPQEYLQYIANDSRDITEAVKTLFQNLLEKTCGNYTRTSTEAPITDATTTTTTSVTDTTTNSVTDTTTTSATDTTTTSAADTATTSATDTTTTSPHTTTTSAHTTTNTNHKPTHSTLPNTTATTSTGSTSECTEDCITLPTCFPTESPDCVWPTDSTSAGSHRVEMVIVDLKVN